LGCPVVTATFNGAREQMGDAALFFDGLDAGEAAAQLQRLTDPELKNTLIRKGHELVQLRSADEYVKKIITALDAFARKRRLWGPCNAYRHL
jgi:glycosyltransferase involved in cell wall biosynthesis